MALFLATRAWMLSLEPLPFTDGKLYARYARETLEARAAGVSLYEYHAKAAERVARERVDDPSLRADWRKVIEYPPLAVRWMTAVARLWSIQPGPGFEAAYVRAYRITMCGVDAALFLLLLRTVRSGRTPGLLVYLVGGALFAHLMYDRFDLLVALVMLLALCAAHAGRALATAAALSVGILLKLSPLFVTPLCALAFLEPSRPWWRAWGRVLLTGLLASTLTGLVMAGFVKGMGMGALDFLEAQGARDFEIGSGPASLLLVLKHFGAPVRTVYSLSSISVSTPWLAPLALLMQGAQVVALLMVALLYFRTRLRAGDDTARLATLALAATATLLFVVLTARVFSPQYLIWVLPPVALLACSPLRSRADVPLCLAALTLTTIIWPIRFEQDVIGHVLVPGPIPELSGPTPLGVALLAGRNALVLAWAVFLTWRLARAGRVGPKPLNNAGR